MISDAPFSPADVLEFLGHLRDTERPGAFKPVIDGATAHGAAVRLGFTCFGVKLLYMLREWERLSPSQARQFTDRIAGYQVPDASPDGHWGRGAFVDPAMASFYLAPGNDSVRSRLPAVILAESKQAVATLAEAGVSPPYAYTNLPNGPLDVERFIAALDWSHPWSAGGQASAMLTLVATSAARRGTEDRFQPLIEAAQHALAGLADPETGAYFRGARPSQGELVNGAMKVLTALDWLGEPVHYPAPLIDTCLSELPADDGCHLVDAIYVLFRCAAHTSHRRGDIQAYCEDVVRLIARHRQPDGGYSYSVGRSQTGYYGVPITKGVPVGDIHGTTLLVWALTMCASLLEHPMARQLRVIRP